MMAERMLRVLLVEDDPGDTELTKAALGDAKLTLDLAIVDDGEKAMAYLRKELPYAGVPTPDVVILDLNLPRKDGRQVLTEIKEDPSLRDIPIVILTTSDAEEDVARSYAAGANCYVTKPLGFPEFSKVVHCINEFWFTIVKLPPRPF
jgi:two-component system, chemotaxis family, response regulator Rcp1